jgi:hypothetical protein
LVISYEDGMVTVYIEEGRASVAFDHEQWDDRYGIYHSNVEFWDYIDLLREGPFPITGLNGAVKDACIAQMDGFATTSVGLMGIRDAAVILLMEDGTVQMALADPGTWDMGENISYESRRIPWLRDIVALSYEADSQSEYGNDMTVYAVDSQGLRYNVRIAGGYGLIMDIELYARQPRIDEDYDNEGDIMTLMLSEDGTAVFQKAWYYGDEIYEIYRGAYEIQIAEDPNGDRLPAGAISFDLNLDWWIAELVEGDATAEDLAFWDAGQTLDGVYLTWINHYWGEASIFMNFFEGKGLTIYRDHRPPDDYFTFFTAIDKTAYALDAAAGSIADMQSGMMGKYDDTLVIMNDWDEADHAWIFEDEKYGLFGTEGFTNEAIIDILMAKLPEAREKVQKLGMAALCTGEITVLDGVGVCRDVWLGTNHPDQFVREILYVISVVGDIYEYDPVEDVFYMVFQFWS